MENKKSFTQLKNEVFNIEKAINRILWRFKNENIKVNESKIIINELDQKAVDFLVNWINQQKKDSLIENQLFVKVFCYTLYHEINFYKGDVKMGVKKLQEQLKLPIDYHYSKIHDTLNTNELINYLEKIGANTMHPLLRTDEQEIENINLFKKNNLELSKKILGTWSKENVYKSLNNTISEIINKFK
jgi:hypothetical protein